MASFLDFLFGKGEKTEQFQKFTPQQQDIFGQLLGGAGQQLPQAFEFLSSILGQDPEAISKFEAPTRRAFEEQTIPSIAERFTGAGAQKSSAFGQQLGKAGKDLEEGLAAQRGNMSFQALSQLMSLLGTGLTPQFENVFRPATGGVFGDLAGSAGNLGLLKLLGLF